MLEHAVVSLVSERTLFGGEISIELPGFVDFADSGDSFGSAGAPLTYGHTAAPKIGTVAKRMAFGYIKGTGLMDSSTNEESNIVAGTIGVDAQGGVACWSRHGARYSLPARNSFTNLAFPDRSLLASIKSENTLTLTSDWTTNCIHSIASSSLMSP